MLAADGHRADKRYDEVGPLMEAVPDREPQPLKVAYVMSRFPKLTETFVLYEILAHRAAGLEVEVYPLLQQRSGVMHPEAGAVADGAHYLPFVSIAIVRTQLRLLFTQPRTYLGTLWAVLRGTWGSFNFFVGAVAIFPKVAHAAQLMMASDVGHVHCHFANHPALAGFMIHRLTGISYSFTAHGSDLHMDRHMLCEKVGEAAFVVPISEYNRELILGECGGRWSGKLHVIHCGVDTEVFRPQDGEPEGDHPMRIVCIGTLHEVKGQRYLIDACRLLAQENVEFECRLIGDGEDRASLGRQIRDAQLGGSVFLEGNLTREEIAVRLRSADVLVAPSVPTRSGKREGIPVVLMEAMSAGLPVIASRISGIPELVDDGRSGLLAPPRDARALAAALRRLNGEPRIRQQLGSTGRAKVRRDFDIHRNAALLRERFLEVTS